MKNKVSGWIAGGLLTVAVLGVSLSNNAVANAAQGVPASMSMQQEKPINSDTKKAQETQKPCCEAAAKEEIATAGGMMQKEKMNQDMMKSEEMQKQCGEMMKDKDMQDMMKQMMNDAEMQKMMKTMMADDPSFKDMMKNMIDDTKTEPTVSAVSGQDHNAHHQI
ncbi:MAG: hypothetical protein AB9883_02590 [Acidaminococcaceae bacterium]